MTKPFDIRERSFQFSKQLVTFITETKIERMHVPLFDQLMRSGTSVGANVEEGKAGSSKRDFKKFYIIALKSANETKYWLRLIKETEVIKSESTNKIDVLINEVDELSKIIASIVINMDKTT